MHRNPLAAPQQPSPRESTPSRKLGGYDDQQFQRHNRSFSQPVTSNLRQKSATTQKNRNQHQSHASLIRRRVLQHNLFRGPLLKCQEAIELNDVDELRQILLEYTSPADSGIDDSLLIGELFTPTPYRGVDDPAKSKISVGDRDNNNHNSNNYVSSFFSPHEAAHRTTLLHIALELQLGAEQRRNDDDDDDYGADDAGCNRIAIVELLILFGAPIWKRNSEGLTACHVAMNCCPHLIVPLLFKYGNENDEKAQQESFPSILEEARSFLRDAIAYSSADECSETAAGRFSPYRLEVIQGLFCLFSNVAAAADYFRCADGTDRNAVDILDENRIRIGSAVQSREILKLLVSPSPADEQIQSTQTFSSVVLRQRHQQHDASRTDEFSERGEHEQEQDQQQQQEMDDEEIHGTTSNASSFTYPSKFSIFFVHPLTRLVVIVLLVALHFVLFLGDFYTRQDEENIWTMILMMNSSSSSSKNSSINNKNKNISSGKFSVASESVDLPFIFKFVELVGSSWISISSIHDVDEAATTTTTSSSSSSTKEKEFLVELLVTRILCIGLGFIVGGLVFAFPVHWTFRDCFKWRMFGAEIVLNDADDELRDNEQDHRQGGADERFSHARLRFFRESIAQSYQPYTDPVTDVPRSLQKYFTRRAVISRIPSGNSALDEEFFRKDAVENDEIKPMINSRNRLFLFFVGTYIGIYCSAYVHDAIVENHILPLASRESRNVNATLLATNSTFNNNNSGSDNNNNNKNNNYNDLYPLSFAAHPPSYATATMHLFHASLYCLVLLFLIILDTMMQAIRQGPLFFPVIHSHGFIPSRRLLKFAANFWAKHRVWMTALLHVIMLAGLAVFHYFDTSRSDSDEPLLPVYSAADVDSSSATTTEPEGGTLDLYHIFVLLAFSTSCVALDFIMLMQEWNLPNLQVISVVAVAAEQKRETTSHQHEVKKKLLEAENAFALPCSSSTRLGNVFGWLLFVWCVNLTIDLSRVYWYLGGSIVFLQHVRGDGDRLRWYHVVFFILALLPLIFAAIGFITLMIRNSTRIKIQHAFFVPSSLLSASSPMSCCTCCSDICCSCRSRFFFLDCCRSDEGSTTASGVRTEAIRRKDSSFCVNSSSFAVSSPRQRSRKQQLSPAARLKHVLERKRRKNNGEGDDDDDRNVAPSSSPESSSWEQEEVDHEKAAEHPVRIPDGTNQLKENVKERQGPNLQKQDEEDDEKEGAVERGSETDFISTLTPEQQHAINSMNAILDSLRKPNEKDSETQTEETHTKRAISSKAPSAPPSALDVTSQPLQPEERMTHRPPLPPLKPNSDSRQHQSHHHQHQHQHHHLDPLCPRQDENDLQQHETKIRADDQPQQQQQQHQQQPRPFYTQDEIQFIDRTSQHYKNDYYARSRHKEQAKQSSAVSLSKPYQRISADQTILQENEFLMRDSQFSVWEMALTNRAEALRLALIRDPSLVSYIGGPGLRCIEKDKNGNQINVACTYEQQLRAEKRRNEMSPKWEYSSSHQPRHLNQNKNRVAQERNDESLEIYFAPPRNIIPNQNTSVNKKHLQRKGDTAAIDSEKNAEDNREISRDCISDEPGSQRLGSHRWVVSLLSDELKIEEAIRGDHRARGGNGDLVDYGATLLHYAIYANCPSICSMLIANGADPTARCCRGQLSCIDLAYVMGRRQIAKRLENFASSIQMR